MLQFFIKKTAQNYPKYGHWNQNEAMLCFAGIGLNPRLEYDLKFIYVSYSHLGSQQLEVTNDGLLQHSSFNSQNLIMQVWQRTKYLETSHILYGLSYSHKYSFTEPRRVSIIWTDDKLTGYNLSEGEFTDFQGFVRLLLQLFQYGL